LRKKALRVKKTFTYYSKKREEEREAFLNRIARIPEKKRACVGARGRLQRERGRAPRGAKVGGGARGRNSHRTNGAAAAPRGEEGAKKLPLGVAAAPCREFVLKGGLGLSRQTKREPAAR
jgi:hypothetical protein